MTLSQRDINVLSFIHRMRYGFVRQIKQRFFRHLSKKACEKAMRKLLRLGLIERKQLPRNIDRPIGDLWFLTRIGTQVLSDFEGRELKHRNIGKGLTLIPQARHRMRMIDFQMAMEEGIESMPLAIKEILVDDRKIVRAGRRMSPTALPGTDGGVFIVPDLIYILKSSVTGQERVYMVEVDCGTENLVGTSRTSVMDKLMRYESLLLDASGSWKKYLDTEAKAFEVVFVTGSVLRIKHLRDHAQKELRYPAYVMANTHEDVLVHGLFESIWERMDGRRQQPFISS